MGCRIGQAHVKAYCCLTRTHSPILQSPRGHSVYIYIITTTVPPSFNLIWGSSSANNKIFWKRPIIFAICNAGKINKPDYTSSLEISGVQISFRSFFIENWTFVVKKRNLMFYSKYCPSYCSSCVRHESWSNNASNSASSYTFSLPLRSLSSV